MADSAARWTELLVAAGLRAVPDGPADTWVIEGSAWVRAGVASESLFFETPIGRLELTPERLKALGHLGQAWGLGRVFWVDGQAIAMASIPTRGPGDLDPATVRALYDHLVDARPALLESRVPPAVGSAPLADGDLEALLARIGLRFDRQDDALLVPIDPGDGHRFTLRVGVEGPQVRFDAYLDEPPPGADPILVNLLNDRTTVGSVALGPLGQLGWAYALPPAWLRDRPDRLVLVFDHAAHCTLQVAQLPPMRQGTMLPWLVAATAPGVDALPALCSGDGAPHVAVVPVDAETLERIPAEPRHPWPLERAVVALGKHLVGWQREGDGLVCEGPFAAEQVLVPEVIDEAHWLLGGDTLAVAVPRRGVLWADLDAGVLQARVDATEAPLCPHVLWVQQGRLVGVVPTA